MQNQLQCIEKHLSDTNGPPYFGIKVVHYRLKVFIVPGSKSNIISPLVLLLNHSFLLGRLVELS